MNEFSIFIPSNILDATSVCLNWWWGEGEKKKGVLAISHLRFTCGYNESNVRLTKLNSYLHFPFLLGSCVGMECGVVFFFFF